MPVDSGTRLGPYQILSPLGAGGMGEVYRALDSRLGREVAIKVLPEGFAEDEERIARFEREARTLASVNHPNVATLHGFELDGDVRFLVMELVEGEDLAARLKRGPIAVDDALPLFIEIAEGLEAAHAEGVVHRDLKPANVKIGQNGRAKVLDFGLAKAMEQHVSAGDLSQSPTLTVNATRAGVLMGTAAYMSPEQARGKPLDKRTDIFSFGCVLFEALTGRGPFQDDTVTDTLSAVLNREPDWSLLPANTPLRLRLLLERCLAKDRRQRLHDIADARIELQEIAEGADESGPAERTAVVRRSPWPVVAAFVAGLALAGLPIWLVLGRSEPERQPVRRYALSGLGMPIDAFQSVLLSPDGSRLVVRTREDDGVERLVVHSFETSARDAIEGSESGRLPFFSPDGESIAFFALGEIKSTRLDGGLARILATTDQGFSGGVWLADDSIYFTGAGSRSLFRLPAGGEVEEIEVLGPEDAGVLASPSRLPRSDAFLLSVRRGDRFDVGVYSVPDRKLTVIAENGFTPTWVNTGHVVYQSGVDGPLVALPFDAQKLAPAGVSFPVLAEIGARVSYQVRMFTVAEDGTLAFMPEAQTPDSTTLIWMGRDGSETPITQIDRVVDLPRISHDGTRIAFRTPAPNCDIWVHDLDRGTTTRITQDGDNHGVAWSPDDRRIASARYDENGLWSVISASSDGAGPVEVVALADRPDAFVGPFSPDGRLIVTGSRTGGVSGGLRVVEVGDGSSRPLFESRFEEQGAVFSPDGRFVAYASNESGRNEVYVQPFPELDARNPGLHRRWESSLCGRGTASFSTSAPVAS